MTEASGPEQQTAPEGSIFPPLGVGEIVADSFSILFRHFLPIVLIGFVPSLAGLLISGSLIGFEAALGLTETDFSGTEGAGDLVAGLIDMVVYSITTAFLVQLAYDAKLRRPVRVARYVGPALAAVVPIAILGMLVGILTAIAAIALVIPGLWVYAVFSVMEPAIVIERIGFRGLGRSAELTKEYRWPILGTIILVGLCAALILFVAGTLAALVMEAGGLAVTVLVFAFIVAIGNGLASIPVALIYARLREIKEGVSVDEIAAVFD